MTYFAHQITLCCFYPKQKRTGLSWSRPTLCGDCGLRSWKTSMMRTQVVSLRHKTGHCILIPTWIHHWWSPYHQLCICWQAQRRLTCLQITSKVFVSISANQSSFCILRKFSYIFASTSCVLVDSQLRRPMQTPTNARLGKRLAL